MPGDDLPPRDRDPGDPQPLDPSDPRFERAGGAAGDSPRRLVRSRGPGASPEDPRVRILRLAVPLVFFAGIAFVALVFFRGLQPGPQQEVLGNQSSIRAAVEQRPRRVCFNDNNPCAWLTLVDDRLVAFNTNGPLPQEYGRAGVGWCATSGWYGANATGSRFDQHGRVARGPAPRGLDRFGVHVDGAGTVRIDFTQLTAGTPAEMAGPLAQPVGPHCEMIPFDREADLPRPGE